MSDMYGFGAEEVEPASQEAKEPAWFRSRMDKVSSEISELKAENDRLKADAARRTVAETLQAQGYAPQAAGLFQGKPEELTDWIGTYGAALAKAEGAPEGDPQGQQAGPPPTTVSPESQAAMANIASASTGGTGPLSGEDQLAARLNAATTEDEFKAIMREAGNVRFQ